MPFHKGDLIYLPRAYRTHSPQTAIVMEVGADGVALLTFINGEQAPLSAPVARALGVTLRAHLDDLEQFDFADMIAREHRTQQFVAGFQHAANG